MDSGAGSEPQGRPSAGQPLGYRLVCRLSRFLMSLFYRRVEVVGMEHIPASGPIILAANHQNALVDPMLLLAAVPRRLVPVAKAPLFAHPLIGPFLRLVKTIPVHRPQDEGSDPARNREMFGAAIATLRKGGAILIFPEGLSQSEPALMPLRTGAARMLLSAETGEGGGLGVELLPVGLVFHEPGSFRTGWALVLVGEAIPTDEDIALYRTSPLEAVRRLTDRLAEALRQLMVEANDRETLRLLHVVESLWEEESPHAVRDPAAQAEWIRRGMRAYRYMSARDPAQVSVFRSKVERYAKDIELTGVAGGRLARSYPAGVVCRYAIREGLPLLVGLPLALWGIANHLIPYQLTKMAVRRLHPPPDAEATYKIAGAVLVYPLCWIAQGWLAWQIGGAWLHVLFAASLMPTGFFALTWRDRLEQVGQDARGYLQFLVNRNLYRRLFVRRRALMDELQVLARQVPESILAGQTSEAHDLSVAGDDH